MRWLHCKADGASALWPHETAKGPVPLGLSAILSISSQRRPAEALAWVM
jgi:hypothetical protein